MTSGPSPCRTRCSARSTRSPRRSTATGSSTPTSPPRRSTWATSTSTGPASTRSQASTRWPTRRCGPRRSTTGPAAVDRIRDPEQTQLVWYAEVGDDQTTIWANFQGADPNDELVEINVRRSVFYPTEHHLDYITVRGFELAQAATPWAPPTADQPGLIGPNWAKGWIIEDNVIHDAKCSAISIGKEASTGHNFATVRRDKPGYQYQLESVFAARQIGWDREHIGSHIVRRNTIYDCGQNGIVGHLGCVFSTIEDNHIYNIAIKREFYGYEIAGIKLHAALDVIIRHNRIHDCSLGIWLDWQTQGTRVSRNLCLRQQPRPVRRGQPRTLPGRPQHPRAPQRRWRCSARAARSSTTWSAARCSLEPVLERPTPYHVPHSTQVAGYAAIHGGDDRHIGNIFLGGDPTLAYGPTSHAGGSEPTTAPSATTGTRRRWRTTSHWWPIPPAATTNASRTSSSRSTSATTSTPPGPNHSRPRRARSSSPATTSPPRSSTKVPRSTWSATLPAAFDNVRVDTVSGADLERVRFVDADFEEPDGTPVVLAADLVGVDKTPTGSYPAGPITTLASGSSRIRVW